MAVVTMEVVMVVIKPDVGVWIPLKPDVRVVAVVMVVVVAEVATAVVMHGTGGKEGWWGKAN